MVKMYGGHVAPRESCQGKTLLLARKSHFQCLPKHINWTAAGRVTAVKHQVNITIKGTKA